MDAEGSRFLRHSHPHRMDAQARARARLAFYVAEAAAPWPAVLPDLISRAHADGEDPGAAGGCVLAKERFGCAEDGAGASKGARETRVVCAKQFPPLKDDVERYTQSLLRDALSQAFTLEQGRLEVVELVRRHNKHQLRSLERKGIQDLF